MTWHTDPILGIITPLHAVVGFVGGGLRALTMPYATVGRRIGTTLVGTVVAGIATGPTVKALKPIATEHGLTLLDIAGVVGLLYGLTGIVICEGIINLLKERFHTHDKDAHAKPK